MDRASALHMGNAPSNIYVVAANTNTCPPDCSTTTTTTNMLQWKCVNNYMNWVISVCINAIIRDWGVGEGLIGMQPPISLQLWITHHNQVNKGRLFSYAMEVCKYV